MDGRLMAILERLQQARQKKGLSQAQAAKYIDIKSISSFSDIERGRTQLSLERLLILCDLYEADYTEILLGEKLNLTEKQIRDLMEKSSVLRQVSNSLMGTLYEMLDSKDGD